MLQQLGVNWTIFIQFAVFVGIISFLSIYVFKPYAKAVEGREQQTKGSEEVALDMDKKSVELYGQYESKARQVHGEIQEVYKTARAQAQAEYDKSIQAARAEAEKYLSDTRQKISSAVHTAQETLKKDTPQIVMALTQKLLGK